MKCNATRSMEGSTVYWDLRMAVTGAVATTDELGSPVSFVLFIIMETDALLLDGVLLLDASWETESLLFTSYCTMVSVVVDGVIRRGTCSDDAVSGAEGSAIFLALPRGNTVITKPFFSDDDDSMVKLGMLCDGHALCSSN